MATAEINPGICGLKTTVHAQATGDRTIHLTIESDCKAVCKLGEQLKDVDPYREFTWRRGGPQTLENAPNASRTRPVPCLPASSRWSRSKPVWRCRPM